MSAANEPRGIYIDPSEPGFEDDGDDDMTLIELHLGTIATAAVIVAEAATERREHQRCEHRASINLSYCRFHERLAQFTGEQYRTTRTVYERAIARMEADHPWLKEGQS